MERLAAGIFIPELVIAAADAVHPAHSLDEFHVTALAHSCKRLPMDGLLRRDIRQIGCWNIKVPGPNLADVKTSGSVEHGELCAMLAISNGSTYQIACKAAHVVPITYISLHLWLST